MFLGTSCPIHKNYWPTMSLKANTSTRCSKNIQVCSQHNFERIHPDKLSRENQPICSAYGASKSLFQNHAAILESMGWSSITHTLSPVATYCTGLD